MNRYILVTGGELRNKGAQAMTYIVTDQMRRHYPNAKVVIFSDDEKRNGKLVKEDYKFIILPLPGIKTRLSIRFPLLEFVLNREKKDPYFADYREYFLNAAGMLDISGFALSSSWAPARSILYMVNVATAKFFHIPVYLMPQSFGPFEYSGKYARFATCLIKKYLPYCRTVYAREEEGKKLLESRFGLSNVKLSPDLVLQTGDIIEENVFAKNKPHISVEIQKNSVGVIPNQKLVRHGSKERFLNLYKNIIEKLIKLGKNVYLVYHATEDFELCRTLKNDYFGDSDKVILVEEELGCLEYSEVVSKFDYIVAARYHSVVLAYRKGIPAIAVGWATKYKALLEMFGQERYHFDIRKDIDYDCVNRTVEKMQNEYADNSETILSILSLIRQRNIFDEIDLPHAE